MFVGYDPNKKPPYTHTIYFVHNGKKYKTTYYVSNGYAGSISVTSKNTLIETEDEEDLIRKQL
mgnify:CR=1 FL=1|tara:strand:- start:74 stop:262 length:189 start_codon:yes stop_codon:yes gene_type:complete